MTDVENNEEVAETSEETESSPVEEEQKVPFSRLKEVIDERDQLRQTNAKLLELDKKEASSPTGLSDEEQKAREYLEKLATDVIEKREQTKAEQVKAEEQRFETDVKHQLELNPSVKKDDFLKFIEEKSDTYGVKSVEGAMRLYRDMNSASEEGAKKAKKDIASKPSLPSNEGGASATYAEQDKGKTLNQIAEEVVSKL